MPAWFVVDRRVWGEGGSQVGVWKNSLMVLRVLGGAVALAGLFAISNGAAAESARPSACRAGITDDRLMPVPAALVGRARAVFQLDMPDELIRKTTVYRCVEGRTLLCTTGANLACGKADTRRDMPGVVNWCREHGQSDSVPMFVTGHDTIYRWRCSDGAPIVATVDTVDARGFLARNWKEAGE